MKIGGFEIKINADKGSHVRPFFSQCKSDILHGCRSDFQHKELLREDIRDFLGRDMKLTGGNGYIPAESTDEGLTIEHRVGCPIASLPTMAGPWFNIGFTVKDQFLEIAQRGYRAKNCSHTDDRDFRILNFEF